MSEINTTNELFFERTEMDRNRIESVVSHSLDGTDDGELYLEYSQSESLSFDDGRLKSASFDTTQGFGLRGVSGETTGYAHASELSEAAVTRAGNTVRAVRSGHTGTADVSPQATNTKLYMDTNPLGETDFSEKVKLLEDMNDYARSLDDSVTQFSASISGEWQAVEIIRPDGESRGDIRPLVRVNVSVVCTQNDRMEAGSYGTGGRTGYTAFISEDAWKANIDEAFRQAQANLNSVPAPAGEMDVVLGPGWPGILLHEAIGHGLEGDFNRKGTSAFAGLMGERVASSGVTVVDDGTIAERRGSISIDDEGTPTTSTVLIENGILTGYMQDRLNARLMGVSPTGNGRRESFAHCPMPRMTNTYMHSGNFDPEEILKSVKKGLYAVNFGGGQVDITSGKFVFSASEAYLIEDGKVGTAVKGATIIGNGPDVLTRVKMIGNDMQLDPGVGTCGKDGQGVPVGVGQPTLMVENLTIGGTAT
ncbi:MAG: Metalloprotease TldD [Alphaproteobacteria bacterium MarineAlpha11_Bin1]|nr:MAG: Metalloprotease TldD [Alphaproteobacteria bacterium MarineAlpha11_Bin1]|tara:strand:+ start:19 stop:1452 length:1434 start_codon:yes stop_codon:yes gene_type:complete